MGCTTSVPDITPAQIGAGATLHLHISGVELVELLGAVDGLAVKKHLLHARVPRASASASRASRTSLFSRSRSSLTCLRDSRSFLLWSFLLCSSSPLSALVLRRSSCFARFFTR
jgi:hypothetical protein